MRCTRFRLLARILISTTAIAYALGAAVTQAGPNTHQRTLAIATPKADSPALAYSFADKFLATLQEDPEYHVQLLEGVSDREQAIAIAERAGFDFLLLSELKAKEKLQLGKRILNRASPGKLDLNIQQMLKVTVEFELRALDRDGKPLTKSRIPPPKRASKDAVQKTAQTLREKVRKALKSEARRARSPENLLPGYEPRLVVQTSHSTAVNEFMYSPDSSRLATLGADGVIKVWNVLTGMELNTIVAPATIGLSFSPKGRQLAALSGEGIVRIFDADTGHLVRRFTTTKREDEVTNAGRAQLMGRTVDVAFSADGSLLAHGGVAGISLWDVQSGVLIRDGDEGQAISQLALSPKGDLVAGVLGKRRIKVLSAKTGKKIHQFPAKVGQVTTLRFSPDGQTLAIGSANGSIHLYNAEDGERVSEPPLYSVCDKPYERFSALDHLEGIDLADAAIDIRDGLSEACAATQEIKQARASGDAYTAGSIRSVAMNPNGSLLAYGRGDGRVQVLDLEHSGEVRFDITMDTDNPLLPDADEQGALARLMRSLVPDFWGMPPVKFSADGETLDVVEDRKTVSRWSTSSGEKLSSLAVAKRDLSFGSVVPIPMASVPIFGRDDRTLLTATITGGTRVWDLRSGLPPRLVSAQNAQLNISPISSDAQLSVMTEFAGDDVAVVVRNVVSGKETQRFPLDTTTWLFNQRVPANAVSSFSPDASQLVIFGADARGRWMKVMDLATGRELHRVRDAIPLGFSPDSKLFAYRHLPLGMRIINFGSRTKVSVLHTDSWQPYFEQKTLPGLRTMTSRQIAFSDDSRLMALPEGEGISVWDMRTGKQTRQRRLEDDSLSDFLFRPGSSTLTVTTRRNLLHWDFDSDVVRRSSQYKDFFGNLSYSANGQLLALGGAENRIRLFDVDADIEVGSLVVPNDDDWLTVTPDGRFDARWLEDVEEVHWVLSDEPDRTHPVELFMREYYEPQLLARLVDKENIDEVPPLHLLNRALPSVALTELKPLRNGQVRVTVEVREESSTTQRDEHGKLMRSGGAGLRVFRDNRLVAYAPDDLGDLTFDAQGVSRHSFDIDLPAHAAGSGVEFAAYAMNSANIKGQTARAIYDGTHAPKGERRAYVLAIGVDASDQPGYELKHAVNDARLISRELTQAIESTGQYASVVSVTVASTVGGAQHATKGNVRALLGVLTGQTKAEQVKHIPGAGRLRKARPDDLVILTFSGHGYTDKQSNFYLLPSDLGKGDYASLESLLPHAISSDEMAVWLADLDADITMVVDACYSASAIESDEFKPGPLGSRGLGQLAYDKGMRVLTGAQKDSEAYESSNIAHGYLSYALASDGIAQRAADFSPKDGRIVAREWIQYPLTRVPELHLDEKEKREQNGQSQDKDGGKGVSRTAWRVQQPVMFNFSRSQDGPLLERTSR